MKKLSQDGAPDTDKILEIISEIKPNQQEQIKFKKDHIAKFFPKSYSPQQMEQVIMKLLAEW